MNSHRFFEFVEVLRLPEVSRAIIEHLTTDMDKLNFSLAIEDFGELTCLLRKENIQRYSPTKDGLYRNRILSLLAMLDDRLERTFDTFDYLEETRTVVTLPNTDVKSFFGLDPDKGLCDDIKWMKKVHFIVDIKLRNDLRKRSNRVQNELIGRVFDFLHDSVGTANILLRTTTIDKTSIFSSRLVPTPKLCYVDNDCVLTKNLSRELLRRGEQEKWSVMIVYKPTAFFVKRFRHAKPVERNMNAPTKVFYFYPTMANLRMNVPVNLQDLRWFVPPCMKRKCFTRIDGTKIPRRHRDIIRYYNSFDTLINLTRSYWSTFFYEPLILVFGCEAFTMPEEPDTLNLYHVRFASNGTIVLSKNIMFAELPKLCKQKLVTMERNVLDCDATGTRLFLNSLNRHIENIRNANPNAETIELPRHVFYSFRHVCSHHPVIDPFLPLKKQ